MKKSKSVNKNYNKNKNVINIHIGDKKSKKKRKSHRKSSHRNDSPITYIQPAISVTNKLPYDTTPYSSGYMPPSMQPTPSLFSPQQPITQPTTFTSQEPVNTPAAVTTPPTATPILSKEEKRNIFAKAAESRVSVPKDSENHEPFSIPVQFQDDNPMHEERGIRPEKTPNAWKQLRTLAWKAQVKDFNKQYRAARDANNESVRQSRAKKKEERYGDVNMDVYAPKLAELLAVEKDIKKEKKKAGITSPSMTRIATKGKHNVETAIEEGRVAVRKPSKKHD